MNILISDCFIMPEQQNKHEYFKIILSRHNELAKFQHRMMQMVVVSRLSYDRLQTGQPRVIYIYMIDRFRNTKKTHLEQAY